MLWSWKIHIVDEVCLWLSKMEVVIQDTLGSHKEVPVAIAAVQKITPLNKAHDPGGSFSVIQFWQNYNKEPNPNTEIQDPSCLEVSS